LAMSTSAICRWGSGVTWPHTSAFELLDFEPLRSAR
jgi:hypothetical protein